MLSVLLWAHHSSKRSLAAAGSSASISIAADVGVVHAADEHGAEDDDPLGADENGVERTSTRMERSTERSPPRLCPVERNARPRSRDSGHSEEPSRAGAASDRDKKI
jgi:hypothetical protein